MGPARDFHALISMLLQHHHWSPFPVGYKRTLGSSSLTSASPKGQISAVSSPLQYVGALKV